MQRLIINLSFVLLCSGIATPVSAASVHKWVDDKGVTHYSDAAPETPATTVIKIDLGNRKPAKSSVNNDYYSIKNQWQRLHKERLEQEKLKLEKSRQETALRSAEPQIVYINELREKQIGVVYQGSFYPRQGHRRLHKRDNHQPGYRNKWYYRGGAPAGLHAGRWKGSSH
ncbi:MAG: DUF4124 domain-containing protein [Gammaproteobacteria bacterium]|nr:DUF4124 domain-containing protein [Gammaproteobacteria bacterium]